MKISIIVLMLVLMPYSVDAVTDTVNFVGNTSLDLIHGKELFNKKADWWEKYSSGIIAALTVFTSLGISVWQARVTQKQSRANSISEARIQWIQEIRPLLSTLISQASEIASSFKEISKYYDKETSTLKESMSEFETRDFLKLGEENLKLQSEFGSTFNQIKLFLNSNEKEHQNLITTMKEFVENSRKELKEVNYKNHLNTNELIKKAQIVLKNAWEQAKSEGKSH